MIFVGVECGFCICSNLFWNLQLGMLNRVYFLCVCISWSVFNTLSLKNGLNSFSFSPCLFRCLVCAFDDHEVVTIQIPLEIPTTSFRHAVPTILIFDILRSLDPIILFHDAADISLILCRVFKYCLNLVCNLLAYFRVCIVLYVLKRVNECVFEIDIHIFAVRFVAAMSSTNPVAPEIDGFFVFGYVFYWRIDDFAFFFWIILWFVSILPDRLMV